jgi:hypothetical protein
MSSIAIGSYVWYTRKDCIVKVLEYDRCSDSYTIESKGKIIDTLARFIDSNIGSRCMIFHDEKLELEGKIADLESYVSNLKERNLAEKQKFETEKRDIDFMVSNLVSERTMLELEIKNLNQKLVDSRSMYEKSIRTMLVKDENVKETIIMDNFLEEKTDKFLWHGINLYEDFEGLKKYLIRELNIATKNTSSCGICSPETVSEFNSWSLQKKEYIIGVYKTFELDTRESHLTHFSGTNKPVLSKESSDDEKMKLNRPCSGRMELIFYTNYGNIISISYYSGHPSTRCKNVQVFITNKILTAKMINIINKSISTGFAKQEYYGTTKTGEELYDFIKDVVSM